MDRLNRTIVSLGGILLLLILAAYPFIFMPSGEAVFREQRCITCHRFRGNGGMAAPDLTGVATQRGTIWIMRQIRDPKSHNPDSRMPSYKHLGCLELYAIIDYLKG